MTKMRYTARGLLSNYWLLIAFTFLLVVAGCASKATPAQPELAKAETISDERNIHEITATEDKAAVFVTIKGNQPLAYTAVKRLQPPGVALYFLDTALAGVEETYTPESALVKDIVTIRRKDKGEASRIQINLKEDVPYEVTQQGNQLLIRFRKSIIESSTGAEEPPPVATQAKGPANPELQEGGEAEEKPAPASKPGEGEVEASQPAWVNRMDFVMLEGDKSRIIVGTTRRVKYEISRPSDKRVLLKLFDTKIPKSQKRPLITTRFKSAVDHIVPVQTARMGDTAVIAIDLREPVPYRVEQKEDLLFVDFEPSSVPPKPMPDMKVPKWQQMTKETETKIAGEAEVPSDKPVLTDTGKSYTGQKISLDFQDADIRHVFRILHDISGMNFVIGDDVQGRVNLKLDNVPWDQILDLIVRMNKLGTRKEGNIVRIATLKNLESERKAVEAERDLEPLATEYISVNYATASDIKPHLDEIKTSRGRLSIDARTNTIIINDVPAAIDNAKQMVRELDKATPQVMIEARIVEADTSFSREIGILWGGEYGIQPGDDRYGVGPQRGYDQIGGTYGLTGGVSDEAGNNWVVNLPPSGPTSGIAFNFARLAGLTPLTLEAVLQAMEAEGKGKIISSPRILTLDNREAYIKQGIEIPYQVKQQDSYSIQWADAVLELKVTPHITMDNRIAMKIVAKKDAPDWSKSVLGTPAIKKKEAGTELLVNDGDTIVIGGIIEKEEHLSKQGVPYLSKIPVLGWLFKSTTKHRDRKELLIFVTPTLVKLEDASVM